MKIQKELERIRDEHCDVASDKYVNARGWPRKGDSRESYDTLMRYEVRDYLLDAHADGVYVGFNKGAEEMAKIKDAQIEGLVKALEAVIERHKEYGDDARKNGVSLGLYSICNLALENLRSATEDSDNFRKGARG